MNDAKVETKYVRAGNQFGDAVSYLSAMGEPLGFELMLKNWAYWEQEYSDRGYRTVSLDDFVESGGFGKNIDSFLGNKREPEEKPVHHALDFSKMYFENDD